MPANLEIGQQLSLMNRERSGYGFQFEHQRTLDQQIESVTAFQNAPFVIQRHGHLAFTSDAELIQRDVHRFLINALIEPWSECSVNVDTSSDHLFGKRIEFIGCHIGDGIARNCGAQRYDCTAKGWTAAKIFRVHCAAGLGALRICTAKMRRAAKFFLRSFSRNFQSLRPSYSLRCKLFCDHCAAGRVALRICTAKMMRAAKFFAFVLPQFSIFAALLLFAVQTILRSFGRRAGCGAFDSAPCVAEFGAHCVCKLRELGDGFSVLGGDVTALGDVLF